jgi:hypothetical protein
MKAKEVFNKFVVVSVEVFKKSGLFVAEWRMIKIMRTIIITSIYCTIQQLTMLFL